MTETSAADSPARSADKTSQHIPLSLSIEPGSITKLLDLFKEMLEATIAKTMAQMPVVHEAKPATQAVELPNSSQSGLDLKPSDKVKAADLRKRRRIQYVVVGMNPYHWILSTMPLTRGVFGSRITEL